MRLFHLHEESFIFLKYCLSVFLPKANFVTIKHISMGTFVLAKQDDLKEKCFTGKIMASSYWHREDIKLSDLGKTNPPSPSSQSLALKMYQVILVFGP